MREKTGFRETMGHITEIFGVGMLTLPQVSAYMHCDTRTVKKWIEGGELSARDYTPDKKTRRYMVPVEALARFITKEN